MCVCESLGEGETMRGPQHSDPQHSITVYTPKKMAICVGFQIVTPSVAPGNPTQQVLT